MTRGRLPVSVVVNASPVMPCWWTLAFWHNENRTPTHGYAERARPQWRHSPRVAACVKTTHPLRRHFLIAKKRRTSEHHPFSGGQSQRCIEMEDQAMSLIQKGYAVSTRGGFLGALFPALLALALLHPGAAMAQEVKQIKLTEKHIQGFMAASKDMAKLYDGADPDKPDPKVE